MRKRFYGSPLVPFTFLFFLFSLIIIPGDIIGQGVAVSAAETEEIEKRSALKEIRSEDGRFLDNGDGTIIDSKTNLIWTKKDSYSDLGKCLNWHESKEYVDGLKTGGHSDWRMPTVKELKTIFEVSKSNHLVYDQDKEYPLHLDSIFAEGAAYGFWTSEDAGFCCARTFYFSNGKEYKVSRDFCERRGVRAVRLKLTV